MTDSLTINRKEQIMEAAAKLFKQNGYPATTMRDLAAELGIEAASIYHHIKSKEDLLETICFGMAQNLLTKMEEVNDIYFNAEEKLKSAIINHVEAITNNTNQSAVFWLEWRNLSEPQLTLFKQQRDQYEQGFRTIIQHGKNEDLFGDVDEKFATLTILSTLNWVIEWYNHDGNMKPIEIANKLSDFILNGLRKKLVTDINYKP